MNLFFMLAAVTLQGLILARLLDGVLPGRLDGRDIMLWYLSGTRIADLPRLFRSVCAIDQVI